mmetsp:Transcript_25791/g.54862  ORF Transcript_25791/g.54862 Transcript_25791/m.54862 type:complete len:219 (+) Transcript_25791:195-851(+)
MLPRLLLPLRRLHLRGVPSAPHVARSGPVSFRNDGGMLRQIPVRGSRPSAKGEPGDAGSHDYRGYLDCDSHHHDDRHDEQQSGTRCQAVPPRLLLHLQHLHLRRGPSPHDVSHSRPISLRNDGGVLRQMAVRGPRPSAKGEPGGAGFHPASLRQSHPRAIDLPHRKSHRLANCRSDERADGRSHAQAGHLAADPRRQMVPQDARRQHPGLPVRCGLPR